MSDIVKHYEKYNQEGGHYFLEHFKGSSRHLMFEKWLKTNVQPGSKVLDIGCGDGSFSHWMPEYQWTGLDIGEPRKAYNGTWLKTNLEESPYNLETGSFDAVVCSEVLEHLFLPEKIHAEAHRLLKPRGVYIISTPNFNWVEHHLKDFQQIVYEPTTATHTREHIRFFTIDTHMKMLTMAGFKPVDFMGADPQWGEFFKLARWELKQAYPAMIDGEIDYLLGKMFREHMHTVGVLAVRP